MRWYRRCEDSQDSQRADIQRTHDHGHPPVRQVSHQLRQPSVVAVTETKLDRHIAAFDGTGLADSFAKGRDHASTQLGRTWVDKSDHRHRALLRARRQRPRRRAA
jgi:hypothetical protein